MPSLDAVIFLATKNSQLEVIQSVGRVMRKAPNKKYGYIIIPIYVPQKEDPVQALDNEKRYEVVWAVLNALKSHDEAFSAIIDKIQLLNMKLDNGVISVFAPEINFRDEEAKEKDGGKASGGSKTGTKPPGTDTKKGTEGQKEFGYPFWLKNVQDAIYARIIDKLSDKFFLQIWAGQVAKIAQQHIDSINAILDYDGKLDIGDLFDKDEGAGGNLFTQKAKEIKEDFNEFLSGLRQNINSSITRKNAVEMLSQHLITAPIFDALFSGSEFTKHNPLSLSMQKMLDTLNEDLFSRESYVLHGFYDNIKQRIDKLDTLEARQKVIIQLYDNFFKLAFPKMAKQLGIAYTPIEVVDFIINSVNSVLKKDFGRTLTSSNVNIIDPFTGTGTFITRILQSGIIQKEDLLHKYESELFANEIVLLAYYIASANIENAFFYALEKDKEHDSTKKEYKEFTGISLTDTFELYEKAHTENDYLFPEFYLKENSERIKKQQQSNITVVVGNPPYSIGQTSANDNAQNLHYPLLEKEIQDTYAKESVAQLNKGLYDSYIKAFKWATLRLEKDKGGVIGFITNAGYIDSLAMDGLRKCLAKDFSDIYILNLRGAIRGKMGKAAKKEGQNIFDIMTGVAITILVKNPNKTNCDIHYFALEDYLTREKKLHFLLEKKDITNIAWQSIAPNQKGDWINQRCESFDEFLPLTPKEKFSTTTKSFFTNILIGVSTCRDAWVYGYSKEKVATNMQNMIKEYNKQTKQKRQEFDAKKISWTLNLQRDFTKKIEHSFLENAFRLVLYRPFCKEHLYYDKSFIERPGKWHCIFPTKDTENRVICLEGTGSQRDFGCLIANNISDWSFAGIHTQCFPLYYYKEGKRFDGVSDFILEKARVQYSKESHGNLTKEDIFYYVYGFLHSKDYRKIFALDLKKSLPRLPLVKAYSDFAAFREAGKKLATLHLKYEALSIKDCAECNSVRVIGKECGDFRVVKMKWADKNKKDTLIYNNHIRIEGIPQKCQEYIVNGRSALDWLIECYRIKTDKASDIVNEPNLWALEQNCPQYILDLILSVIALSVRTLEIVEALPCVNFGEKESIIDIDK